MKQGTQRTPSLSRAARLTLQTLGGMIRAARSERKFSQDNLAERLNVSRYTVIALEKGKPSVAIGVVFEAAAIVGIPLLAEDEERLRKLAKTVTQFSALLPKRIRTRPVDDNF